MSGVTASGERANNENRSHSTARWRVTLARAAACAEGLRTRRAREWAAPCAYDFVDSACRDGRRQRRGAPCGVHEIVRRWFDLGLEYSVLIFAFSFEI